MIRLTPPMRDALIAARRPEGLRRVHDTTKPGKPPWPAHPSTLAALTRHGLVTRHVTKNARAMNVDIWKITDQGLELLDAPIRIRAQRPRYVQREVWRGGDYTSIPAASIDWDPALGAVEVLEPGKEWWRSGRIRHAESIDPRTRARQARAA